MESHEIRQLVQPFHDAIRESYEAAWMDGMAAIAVIGNVRKGERAAILHAAIRESLRDLCDACDPFLIMTEEPEGKALDAMRLTVGDQVLALRWARYDQFTNRINRNDSIRTTDMQNQLFLFGEHFDPHGIPTATISYQIDNDEVVGGIPQWWMSKITLRRERVDSTEFVQDVAVYSKPDQPVVMPDPRTPEYIVTRQNRRDLIEQMGNDIRSALG